MADEVRSREWLGEEESVRNSSSKRVGRNQRGYYAEELGIDNETEKSRETRKRDNKDRKKERREEKNSEGKDKERFKHWEKEDISGKEIVKHGSRERMGGSRDKRKENQEDYGKLKDELELDKEKVRDKIRDRDFDRIKHREDKDNEKAKDRLKEHDMAKDIDHDRDRSIDKEFEHSRGHGKDGGREAKSRVKERDKDKHTDHGRERSIERERDQNHDYVKDKTKDGEKDKGKRKHREKEVDVVADQDKSKGRDRGRDIDRDKEVAAEENLFIKRMADISEGDAPNKTFFDGHSKAVGWQTSTELKERLKKMREDRINGNSVAGLTSKEILEEDSGILSWVSKSRKLEQERNAEKEKAMALSRMLDEQDRILDESEDELTVDSSKDLAGMKVIHGLDKVMEGSTIVLTLKDQNILADGDINEDIDMLESVEIGEQKRRDKAYLDAKRNTGKYDDKFNEDLIFEKTVLPQYNDSIDDEGVTLDESGGFTGEAEKKLAELRKRIEGNYLKKDYVDLSLSGKIQSDYFTTDEMLQFKKPKKKKSLRKKPKLDLDALEAEARAAGLGVGDLGTRDDTKRQSAREEEEKSLAKARSNAYQTALAKAEEASKILRQEQSLTSRVAHYDNPVFGEDYDDLQKSIEQARKLSLKKPDEAAFFGPQAVALLATAFKEQNDVQGSALGDTKGNKVVITEMEEFVLGLQINEETTNLVSGDVFKDEEVVPKLIGHEPKADNGGWTEAKEIEMVELSISGESGDVTPDEIIHETAVGKGLASALKLLKNRGTLKESIDWGGRNMDKKKSKLVGIDANDGSKEIRIERTDEFGRIMTPKEAFRMISHRFHGKGPGKMKQEKRMKQYQEDLKTKQMKASDTPLLAMEKMREAQSRLKMPYLVLSGHVKPGQSSDPTSGFATVEKDNPGSLTPMLGDKKVEHFLGIRSKPDSGRMGPPPPKKPKI